MASPIADNLRKFLATQTWAQPARPLATAPESDSGGSKAQKGKAKDRSEGPDLRDGRIAREGTDPFATGNSSARSQTSVTSSVPGVSSRKGPAQTALSMYPLSKSPLHSFFFVNWCAQPFFFSFRDDVDEDKYKQRSGTVTKLFWSTFG